MINRTYDYSVVLVHLAKGEPVFQNFFYLPSTLLFHTVLWKKFSVHSPELRRLDYIQK